MFSPHSFLQLVPNRASAAIERLRATIWTRVAALPVEATLARAKPVPWPAARHLTRRRVVGGSIWGRLYDQRWCRIAMPANAAGDARYLEWQDQGEATLYAGGVPHYGFDVAHRHVRVPGGERELWVESYCIQSAIWHPEATGLAPKGSRFTGAFICRRDDDAWHAYHDLKCLFDLLAAESPADAAPKPFGQQSPLLQCAPVQRRLLRALDELCDALDTGGAAALRRHAAVVFQTLRQPKPFVRAVLTGHAHIDLVWLWPERIGEAKTVHTFATANRLMSLYPEFRFAASQPAAYAAVRRHAPGLFAQVRRRLRSGRWQATGALYIESDTLLPCGEALARAFVCGQEDFVALRGEPSRLLWLPDVFGYSGCLPQLMRLAGIDAFFTTKLTWSAISRFPHSSFVWRGTDGNQVVAHVTQDTGYNNSLAVDQLVAAGRGHAQCDVHDEILHPTGYGDGGGGPTEEMCERARRLDGLPGLPALRWDHPEAFFERLSRLRPRLPVHHGECYLEYHRGTYTTHGRLKEAFRALEHALQAREAAAVVQGRAPDLGAVWRRLIFTQFHDHVTGTSVPEVYAEAMPELRRHAARQLAAARRELDSAAGEDCLFNPLPLARRLLYRGRLVGLPALSGVPLKSASTAVAPVVARGRRLTNGRVVVAVDARGELAKLAIDDTLIALRPGAGRIMVYPDRPANFEAWDIDRQALALGRGVSAPTAIAANVEAGGLRGAITVRWRVGRHSRATVRYVLEADSPVLRVEIDLDWREPESLLKLHFATDYRGVSVRCGAPFGTVLRPQQPVSTAAEAMWEMPASRHVTLTDDGATAGLSVITQSKYGFSVCNGNVGVSLVRSPRMTGFETHRNAYPPGLSRLRCDSIYSDQGGHRIRLALARYRAVGPRESQPAALAETLFAPVIEYRGRPAAPPGWLGLSGGNTLVPCWAMPLTRGDWLLRLHEVGGERGAATVSLARGWSAQKANLRGEPLGAELRDGRLEFHPYEIIGLRLTRS